jgi:two-component system, response regulator
MNAPLILLVEDNPDDVELTLSALKRSNINTEVAVASDGIEALDYIFGTGRYAGRDTNQKPAVILLDLNLPRLRGTEVLRRLRADPRSKTIPTVMLTTSREERDLKESYRWGANSYIRKPVDFQEFVSMVQDLTKYWLALNETVPAEISIAGSDPESKT